MGAVGHLVGWFWKEPGVIVPSRDLLAPRKRLPKVRVESVRVWRSPPRRLGEGEAW